MIRTYMISLFLGLLLAPCALAQISATLNDDGHIVISGEDVVLLGLDFTSADSLLVPAEGGDASPFGFLLANSPEQITYGSLPIDPVTISGEVTLGAGYAGDFDADVASKSLVGSWGGLEDGDPLPIRFPTAPPMDGGGANPDPIIPEPSTGVLALFGLLAAGFVRRSRNITK